MQGDDDQVVPYKNAAILQDKLLPNSQLIIYPGFPHGMHTSTPIPSTPICWRLSAPDLPFAGQSAVNGIPPAPWPPVAGARRLTSREICLTHGIPDDYFPLAG
jgi:fermentation-respiration switch protein FrsA (DUF1100 family)